MHVLIVKLGSIGDIIHTLPALAVLRRAFPAAKISWVVEERSAEILRGNPMIDHLIEIDTRSLRGGKVIEKILLDVGKQVRELRKSSYDVAIDLQGLLKSAGVAKLSRAKERWGFSKEGLREPAARMLYTDTVSVESGIHVIRKNLSLVGEALGIDVPREEFEFPIASDPAHVDEARLIAESAGGNFAILNPAGGWVTKLWPAEKFGQLADRIWNKLGLRSVVVTGPNEAELASQVAEASRSGGLTLAEPSLKGFFELAKIASVYLGGDTGPTHIAVAAGAPVVGIFGPTEWWRNGSPRPDDICVERNDISCRIDCHRRTCGHWICLDIDVETVLGAVRKRVSRAAIIETSI